MPEAKRNIATDRQRGGSFGQFTLIPLAQIFIGLADGAGMVIMGALGRRADPAILWITQGRTRPRRASAARCPRGSPSRRSQRRRATPASSCLPPASSLWLHVAFIAPTCWRGGELRLAAGGERVVARLIAVQHLGSLWIGRVITGRRMKVRCRIYFARAAMIIAFSSRRRPRLPFLLFAAGIGFS